MRRIASQQRHRRLLRHRQPFVINSSSQEGKRRINTFGASDQTTRTRTRTRTRAITTFQSRRGSNANQNGTKYKAGIQSSFLKFQPRRNLNILGAFEQKEKINREDEELDLGDENDHRKLTQFVRNETEALTREILLPLNKEHLGPLEEESDKRPPLPFVFLLGNHSSGKSSFVNHLIERRVQETGLAPTDDGFTLIAPGPEDIDQDGPSLVGDPDMGFSGLRGFGPSLIHHTRLKIRKDLGVNDIMLIDSPGMIDSPTDSIQYKDSFNKSDRGYNFEDTTRWFAERADVILLFFDPDKPGTTGETLSVLTNSLAGLDHKLHIVLNKVDQFKKIHDFARAYGSLCWNLSKVIPRKDLPRIYTMFTPVTMDKGNAGRVLKYQDQHRRPEPFNQVSADLSWKSSLMDLEDTRKEVIRACKMAPARRIDNMISDLYDSTRLLRMHMVLSEAIRLDYQGQRKKILGTAVGVGVAGNVVSLAALYLVPGLWGFSAVLSSSSLAGAAGVYLYGNYQLDEKSKQMSSDAFLQQLFDRVYGSDTDQFHLSLWHRIRSQLKNTIETIGVANLSRVSAGSLRQLDAILDKQVPALRRKVAPKFHS